MCARDCEQLTLFPADSHASPSVWLESREANGMTATFGLKCCELSKNLRRVGLSVRMYLESCELPRGMWLRIWSARAITSSCLLLRLLLSERRTGGSESRLWATPSAMDSLPQRSPEALQRLAETARKGRSRPSNLREQVDETTMALWPTPTARDYKDGGATSCANVPVNGLLGRAVHLYPTPKAQNARGGGQVHGNGGPSLDVVAGGSLNPAWVEWLMGYPVGWTDLNA